jgi:endogenous inhibitor of DNA gyrase (YacG/DUF329 family)
MTRKPDTCPLCGKPADAMHKPFCSQGCKDRDLINWLVDGYRVPGEPVSLEAADGLDRNQDASL